MRLLVVGSGAREHAIVWKLHQSPQVEKIYCAPGNPGIGTIAENVQIDANDVSGLLQFAIEKKIDLTIPGPEAPLVSGIVDEFEAQGLSIFGPSGKAAELEGSKAFAKWLMQKYEIPTAAWQVFHEYESAKQHLSGRTYPCVIKADGLAAGKGAIVVQNFAAADAALRRIMLEREFGEAGRKVVVEDFLQGEEASVFAISDGEHYALLPPAQDHKAIFDNDEGPNTGGMGAFAPAPVVSPDMMQRVAEEIIAPTIKAMAKENRPYRGVLYAGLMITADGPKVIEFNCRFGDPETQVVLPLLGADLLEMLHVAVERRLANFQVNPQPGWAVCVVMASSGYPGPYQTGKEIIGLDRARRDNLLLFHAGTAIKDAGKLVTSGGRVLSVVGLGDIFTRARDEAYAAVRKIAFDGAYYRTDIGTKALRYLQNNPREVQE